jgi:hypothetical protein
VNRLAGLLAPLLLLLALRAPAQPAPQVRITAGIARNAFLAVNPQDMDAAFRTLGAALGRNYGYDLRLEARFFDQTAEFQAAVAAGEIQVGLINPWEFMDLHANLEVEPAFVHIDHEQPTCRYLLLTSRRSGLNAVSDLRGLDLLVLDGPAGAMALPWLETILDQERLGPAERFFGRLEMAPRASAAVQPVFFGSRQACVLDQGSYQVMAELNPQLGEALQAIAVSPPYANGLMLLARKGWPSERTREDFRRAMLELPRTPEGRQLLTMFRTERLEPFRPELLDSAQKLKSDYLRVIRKRKP